MTGFGSASGDAAGVALRVDVRTVNSRGLDLVVKTPPVLGAYEAAIARVARAAFARGRIEVGVRVTAPGAFAVTSDDSFVERANALRRIAARAGIAAAPCLHDLFLFGPPVEDALPFDASQRAAIDRVVSEACAEARRARDREGDALRLVLDENLRNAQAIKDAIAAAAPSALAAHRERQRARLASGGGPRAELPAELVLARDVTEEIDRLGAHFAACRQTLDAGGALGRRLDFLASEMLREAATLTSKAPSAEIALKAIDLRCEIEKIREQAQNVE